MRTLKLKKLKRIHGLHFAPDGTRLLAVGGEEARMVDSAVWLDLATGENVGRIDQFAGCYAVDPKLTRYVLGGATRGRGWGGIADVQWTPLAGEVAWQKVDMPRRDVHALAFDRAGDRLAICAARRSRSGGEARVAYELFTAHLDPPQSVSTLRVADCGTVASFNAAGTRLVIAGGLDWEPVVDVVEAATGKPLLHFSPPATVTRCATFLPDDRIVVANGRNVYVLPPDKPEPLFTLEGHPKQVNAVALTPDGRRLLTASHDGSIRAWDANTGEPGPQFDWGIGPVTALAFAPDGLTCAAGGLNGKVVVWDVDG